MTLEQAERLADLYRKRQEIRTIRCTVYHISDESRRLDTAQTLISAAIKDLHKEIGSEKPTT